MGFEPTVRLYTVQRFSKPSPSAARPPLRLGATRRLPSPLRDRTGEGQFKARTSASLTRPGLPLPAIAFIT